LARKNKYAAGDDGLVVTDKPDAVAEAILNNTSRDAQTDSPLG